jgi:hypothetical protein
MARSKRWLVGEAAGPPGSAVAHRSFCRCRQMSHYCSAHAVSHSQLAGVWTKRCYRLVQTGPCIDCPRAHAGGGSRRHRHTHTPAVGLYRGGCPRGPCDWHTVLTWHGRRLVWVCHHYEQCAVCGRVLRAELPAEDCPVSNRDKPHTMR